MGFFDKFLHQKLILLLHCFWVSASALFLALFQFLNGVIFSFRIIDDDFSRRNNSNSLELTSDCREQDANITEFQETKENVVLDNQEEEDDDAEEEEEETPKFFFKFQYQTCRENYEPIVSDSVSSTITNKYEFLPSKDSNLYLEKADVISLRVKELYADSIANCKEIGDNGISPVEKAAAEEEEYIHDESKEEAMKNLVPETRVEGSSLGNEMEIDEKKKNMLSDHQVSIDHDKFLSEKDFVARHDSNCDSDSDSITSNHEFISRFIAATSDGFSSEEELAQEEDMDVDDMTNLQNQSAGEDDDIIPEKLKNLEDSNMQNSDEKAVEGNNNSEDKPASPDSSAWDSDDSNGLETLWEHQELIEQLKMELKKVRATGLPTILEEDESPKIMEDLKPWKIDDKFQYADRMSDLHKFYKSYRERMRKLDILNYQKMYALGFLQSKDPRKSDSSNKASTPALTSFLSQKFPIGKRKKSVSDPMISFINELNSELEMVYVGQMCLSWEMLHWQYEKALEIWDSDPYGLRRYNEVAGEFQQFQVLMQRFIENEPFEGPRVQNYVKNRCILRNLLQVPVIREDGIKDKNARRKPKDDSSSAIKSDTLVEIMEESIRIFWRFVRADKDAHNVIQKSRRGTQIEPQDPTELELLTEVRTSLQKKEKKLRDILRSGNCILKKFQKNHEESSSDQVLYFFSQVDMKLVSRVLNMSKITTDQLIWCSNKLDKINFVSRKIHVEPSFLLFPC